MRFMDLFRRKPVETRSGSAGYTAQVMAARHSVIIGGAGLGDLTSAVQSSVTLWEGGLSLADVKGTDLLTPRALAMAARGLALRGEALFLIRDRLVTGSSARPGARRKPGVTPARQIHWHMLFMGIIASGVMPGPVCQAGVIFRMA